jgi:NADH:ubiquinone oxidoreductase subunit K
LTGFALLTAVSGSAAVLFWLATAGLWKQQFRPMILLAAGLILFAFPIGTLIAAITLHQIYHGKGRYLFNR